MSSWDQFAAEAPELAATVKERFTRSKHSTLATVRKDGSPRISGSEVEFRDGEVWLGSMPGALKALDLQRDPRFALHSPTVDPVEGHESDWPGEAKLAGRAVEVGQVTGPDQAHQFRLDLTEVVFTRVDGDRLQIESWHPGRGVERRSRA